MKRLYLLTLCTVSLAVAIFFSRPNPGQTKAAGKGLIVPTQWLDTTTKTTTPPEFRRPADQSFLTFPEWYLVFSPDEQAHYFSQHTATDFPFMQHIAQFWQSYAIMKRQIRDHFAYNTGYHFMIWVIGCSASIEYTIRSVYEKTVGRLTDTKNVVTEEDAFTARYMQAYVKLIKDRPWYEFDYRKQLIALWQDIPFKGDHFLRTCERRYCLTTELLVKWGYAKLIGLGTATVYEVALPSTAVLVDSLREGSIQPTILAQYADGTALLEVPRYDRFAKAVDSLAQDGYHFIEIAGNRSALLITMLTKRDQTLAIDGTKVLFEQTIASAPDQKRVALAVPVRDLHLALLDLQHKNIPIEHLFDF